MDGVLAGERLAPQTGTGRANRVNVPWIHLHGAHLLQVHADGLRPRHADEREVFGMRQVELDGDALECRLAAGITNERPATHLRPHHALDRNAQGGVGGKPARRLVRLRHTTRALAIFCRQARHGPFESLEPRAAGIEVDKPQLNGIGRHALRYPSTPALRAGPAGPRKSAASTSRRGKVRRARRCACHGPPPVRV